MTAPAAYFAIDLFEPLAAGIFFSGVVFLRIQIK
jgi:hypothetical protein